MEYNVNCLEGRMSSLLLLFDSISICRSHLRELATFLLLLCIRFYCQMRFCELIILKFIHYDHMSPSNYLWRFPFKGTILPSSLCANISYVYAYCINCLLKTTPPPPHYGWKLQIAGEWGGGGVLVVSCCIAPVFFQHFQIYCDNFRGRKFLLKNMSNFLTLERNYSTLI